MNRLISSCKRFSSSINTIKTIGVAGSGQMGTGIGYVFSRVARNNVILYDENNTQLEKSKKFINSLIDKEIAKNTLQSNEKDNILSSISYSSNINDFKNADFVVEVILIFLTNYTIRRLSKMLELKKSSSGP